MGKFVLSDGRAFTDYRPNCEMNKKNKSSLNSLEYRQLLQKNAVNIMKTNYITSVKKNNEVCN